MVFPSAWRLALVVDNCCPIESSMSIEPERSQAPPSRTADAVHRLKKKGDRTSSLNSRLKALNLAIYVDMTPDEAAEMPNWIFARIALDLTCRKT